jgi:hypothetical protein
VKLTLEKVRAPDPPITAGNSDTVEIRRRNVLHSLLGNLRFDYTMTGGTGAGSIPADALFRLIKRIVVNTGRDIQAYGGPFLYLYHVLFAPESFTQTPPTSVAAGANETDREAWYEFPFSMDHSFAPEEFGLPTADPRVVNPTFHIEWSPASELVVGNDGVVAVANTAFDLYERAYLEPRVPAGGFAPLLIKQKEVAITATGEVEVRLSHLLSRSDGGPGHELRAVFIEAYSGGVSGADYVAADDVVDEIRFQLSGRTVQEQVAWRALQQINRKEYQLAALQAGLAVIDAAADKKTGRGELFSVSGREEPVLTLDVTKQAGDNKVVITTIHTAR